MFISGAASGAARVESLEPRRLLSSAHLLKDISPAGLDPQHITTIGSRVFFDSTARGKTELWTSDGTSKGTKSLHTFGSDTTSGGYLQGYIDVNGTLFFYRTDSSPYTTELWKSDGTDVGTVLVKTIPSDTSQAAQINEQIAVGKKLFFITSSTGNFSDDEVWVSNGTAKGTFVVPSSSQNLAASGGLVSFQGKCFFKAQGFDSDTRLFSSDGVTATEVADIGPSYLITRAALSIVAVGNLLYFDGASDAQGGELWRSDGTAKGTALVADILPGTDGSGPYNFQNVNGQVYFTAFTEAGGSQFYRSDGTANGTVALTNALPNPYDQPTIFQAVGDTLFFVTSDDTHGQELWRTAGDHIEMVSDINPGSDSSNPTALTSFGGRLLFAANDGTHGVEMWQVGATGAATMIADRDPGTANGISNTNYTDLHWAILNGRVMLSARGDGGSELYSTDGTAKGFSQVYDLIEGSYFNSSPSSYFATASGLVYFLAGEDPESLYRSDGTTAGTYRLVETTDFTKPVDGGSVIYFLRTIDSACTLWSSDGTVAGTRQVITLPLTPQTLSIVNGKLIVYAAHKLYTINKGALVSLGNLNLGESYDTPKLFAFGSNLYFFASGDSKIGDELYKTDGTAAGTVLVKDINPGSASSAGGEFTIFKSQLYFTATDADHGWEIFSTDGTAAGTKLLKDLSPGTDSLGPNSLSAAGGFLYFLGGDASHVASENLWRSDGTAAGTIPLHSFSSTSGNAPPYAWPHDFVELNGKVYFMYDQSLWSSDGSVNGTQAIKTVGTTYFTDEIEMVTAGGRLFFIPDRGKVWESDGTPDGTVTLPGSGTDFWLPMYLTPAAGGHVVFRAESASGVEPWTIDSAAPAVGTITGVVFNDFDRDGVRDDNEPPLAGYRVYVDRNNDGVCNKNEIQTRASSTGRYTFSGLPAGQYLIRETTVETRLPTGPTSYSVKVTVGGRVVRSFGNVGGKVTGVVFHDTNRNGVRDAGEAGIASAHVFLDANNNGVWDTNEYIVRASSSGRYTFSDVPAGTYRIRVFDVPGWSFTNPAVRKVVLPAGGNISRYLG